MQGRFGVKRQPYGVPWTRGQQFHPKPTISDRMRGVISQDSNLQSRRDNIETPTFIAVDIKLL